MGLIHWWPLNGDTYDYGSNPKHGSIVGTASLTEPGKLGTCLSAGNGAEITAGVNVTNCNLLDEISDKYSAAMWIKVHGTHIHYEGAFISSGNWNNQRWTFGINQANNRIQPLTNASNQNYISLGKTLTTDQWYHVVTTYENGTAYLYLDGELVGSVAATAPYQSSATNLYIGRETYANGYFSFNGDICDVRIYDHALSLAEIHELKSGLLLHYNFEDYTGSTNLKTNPNSWSSSYSCDGSGTTKGTFTAQSDGSVLVVDNDTNTRFYSSQRIPVKVGDKLTFSIKYKLVSGTEETFRWQIGEYNAAGTRVKLWWSQNTQKVKDLGDGWKLYYYHFTAESSDVSEIRFYLQDGVDYIKYTHSYYLKDFKIEKEHTDNPIFETTEYSTEYDCSGNEHNAAINGVQNSIDAATGVHSAYFLDGGQWLEHTGAAFDASTLSVSLWWKSSCTAAKTGYHIPFAIDSGRVEISVPNNGQLRWGGYINGSRKCDNATCKDANGDTFSLNNGKWHHIVSVFDGTGFLGYVDGIYQGKQSGSGTISYSGKTLRIGKYSSPASSNYGATDAYISDVRVYNTVLTEADIQSLYKHTVKITEAQAIIGNYFIEKGDQENVTYFAASDFTQGGWSGNVVIDGNEVILTATNGWRGFVLNTPPRFIGKNGVLSFEYCFTDKTNWDPGSGAWVHTTSKTAQYLIGSGPKLYDIPVGEWKSISLPLTNLTDYFGWTLRGYQNGDGASIVMRLRNARLLVDKEVIQILPTGTINCNGINQIENVRIEQHGLLTASEIIEM